MQIVIDIPEKVYRILKYFESAFDGFDGFEPSDVKGALIKATMQGKVLPKGHGELKDVSKFIYDCDCGVCDKICCCDNCVHHIVREKVIKDAPTIIEADKEIDK